jgi:cytochrome c-type biogenesis protein
MSPDISAVALLTSLAAGFVSFLSPCVLPLVPAYVSYIAGQSLERQRAGPGLDARLAALALSLCFVLGFSTVFVILGASATALGQLLLSHRYAANLVGGTMVILFGIAMTGVARWSWLQRELRLHISLPSGRPLAAYALGLAFAFGWTPCIGPVLGTILTTSAVGATVSRGILLLAAYSIGLGLPFLIAALVTDGVLAGLRRLRAVGRGLQLGTGVVVVGMGIAMITGQLSTFSYWLLEAVPAFARIG